MRRLAFLSLSILPLSLFAHAGHFSEDRHMEFHEPSVHQDAYRDSSVRQQEARNTDRQLLNDEAVNNALNNENSANQNPIIIQTDGSSNGDADSDY